MKKKPMRCTVCKSKNVSRIDDASNPRFECVDCHTIYPIMVMSLPQWMRDAANLGARFTQDEIQIACVGEMLRQNGIMIDGDNIVVDEAFKKFIGD